MATRKKTTPAELPEELRLRRLRAKVEAERLKAELAYYKAADKGRRNRDWRAPPVSADLAIVPDLPTMVARSRQIVANTWIGKAAKRAAVRNVVGRGIMVVPTATGPAGEDLPELNRAAGDWFMRWASDPKACDVEGRRTWWQMQRAIIGEKFEAGTAYLVWSYVPSERSVGLKFQLFEVEQLDQGIQSFGGNQVRGGVEVDRLGAAVAYHFYERNPNDLLALNSYQSRRIEANRVLAFYDAERVMQTHGVPAMAACLQDIRDFGVFQDATLWRAKLESFIGLVIKSELPSGANGFTPTLAPRMAGDSGLTPSGISKSDFMPGMVAHLRPGEDVQSVGMTTPGQQYQPFTETTLRGVGAAIGQSYGALTRHNDGNYSAARQDMLEDEREIGPEQDALIDHVILPTYELFFYLAAAEGRLPLDAEEFVSDPLRFVEAEYIAPARPWIDPEKEINAYAKAIEMRIISRKEIVAMRGGRLQNLLQQLKHERDEAAANGITLPEDEQDPKAMPQAESAPEEDENGAAGLSPQSPENQGPDAAAPADGANDAPDITLNGAQITAAIETITSVRQGVIPPLAAVELLSSVGIPRDKAQEMVKEVQDSPPPAEATPSAPSPAKLQSQVEAPGYAPATGPVRCGACRFFVKGRCEAYDFAADPDHVCEAFEAPPVMDAAGSGHSLPPGPPDGTPPIDSRDGFAPSI